MSYKERLKSFRTYFRRYRLDAFLVTHLPNIRYLCGFTGSAGALLVSRNKAEFFTDGRYREQAGDEVQGARVIVARKAALAAAAERLAANGRKAETRAPWWVGVEAEHLTLAERFRVGVEMRSERRLKPVPPVAEVLRMVKDEEEIKLIRAAVSLGDSLFERALQVIRPGVKEVEVAAEMEYAARRGGAEGMSFPTIIAAGERSALPHARASEAAIPRSGFVVCDFGVILAGYCSDMTRTVHVDRPGGEARRLYEAVREAQQAAVDAVRPGVSVGEVDQAARKLLQKRGFGQYFTHSTGHGVGLEIHEAPKVAADGTEILKPGMVITIEPGAYIPGKHGVRIEDMVVVTERGCEVLTSSDKELVTI
jgi:Xaa-Pro aminopeptidase